jgi:hypothetical protein
MKPDPDRASYASYLLRMRWALRDGRPVCQAMLIDVLSKQERRFPDLSGLVSYLQAQGSRYEGADSGGDAGTEVGGGNIVVHKA